jgi:DNA-binding XRE family transcriptional regulator
MHNRLKQFLAAENITQAQFANTIGVGKANI